MGIRSPTCTPFASLAMRFVRSVLCPNALVRGLGQRQADICCQQPVLQVDSHAKAQVQGRRSSILILLSLARRTKSVAGQSSIYRMLPLPQMVITGDRRLRPIHVLSLARYWMPTDIPASTAEKSSCSTAE